jgi:hypothetical protein
VRPVTSTRDGIERPWSIECDCSDGVLDIDGECAHGGERSNDLNRLWGNG